MVDGDHGSRRLLELDGTKGGPVDHGSVQWNEGEPDVLGATAAVVRTRYMEVDPGSIEFSLMALCKVV